MKIGEMARLVGVHVSTVRFYEREGILPKPSIRESGYREYSEHDLDRLRLIVAAKRHKFRLSQIRLCLDALDQEEPCKEIADIVEGQVRTLDKQIEDLQNLRKSLKGQLNAWKSGALPKAECLCAILQTDAHALKGDQDGKKAS